MIDLICPNSPRQINVQPLYPKLTTIEFTQCLANALFGEDDDKAIQAKFQTIKIIRKIMPTCLKSKFARRFITQLKHQIESNPKQRKYYIDQEVSQEDIKNLKMLLDLYGFRLNNNGELLYVVLAESTETSFNKPVGKVFYSSLC